MKNLIILSNIAPANRSAAVFLIFCAFLIFCGLLTNGCGSSTAPASSGKLRVLTTTGMIGDASRRVGGERVEVTNLMGAGVDPHLYRASEGDVRRLSEADIVFFNGLHLEAGMGEVLQQMSARKRTVAVAEAIGREQLIALPNYGGSYDPHVWFDVRLWMLVTERIRDSLIEADGQNAETYRANAADYLAELRGLDAEIRARFEKIPPEQRVLITAHDAFGYFGRAYNFEVRGLQGISTSAEASAADVQELARFIAERKIAAVFVETSVPQRTIEAVQAAVRSRGFETSVGGSLYSDAMGDAGTPEGTYVGMVRRNADTIFNALAGANASVPDR